MKYTFRVVRITNNSQDYPDDSKDTEEFPQLVEWVSDEEELFVVCLETRKFWKIGDFFYMVDIEDFSTETFKNPETSGGEPLEETATTCQHISTRTGAHGVVVCNRCGEIL